MGLWAARAVMTPVAFALFIIALVWPLQRRLKVMLPQVIAVLLTAGVALFAIGCGGWLVVWGFGGIAQWVIANAARLQGLYCTRPICWSSVVSTLPNCSPSRLMYCGSCRFCVRSAAAFRAFSASAS